MKRNKEDFIIICGIIFLCVLVSAFVLAIGNRGVIIKVLAPTERVTEIRTEQVRIVEPVIIEYQYQTNITNNITTREGITQQIIDSANAIYQE